MSGRRDPFRGLAPEASAAQRRAQDRARRADAARLLPLLGFVLLLAPDLMLAGRGGGATAPWAVYLFGAWGGLIALAALVARGVRRDRADLPGGPGR